MKHVQKIIACAIVAAMTSTAAPATPIGLIIKNGDFKVDSARLRGNATLFEGSHVEAGRGLARIHLNSGAQMQLAAGSSATVFRSRIELKSGATAVAGIPLPVEALSLRVQTDSPQASARVLVVDPGTVRVAAVQGSVSVRDRQGLLLARVPEGVAVNLSPAAEDPSTLKVTGTLTQVGERFVVTDEVTGVKTELRGAGLDQAVGKRVQATGTLASEKSEAGAAHVMSVQSWIVLENRKDKAGAAIPAAAGGGLSTTSIAIIAGVGVAAAGSATAVALNVGDDEPTTLSPSSR